MGDLFDIANLITTVGVDAVKIKPEPGLPEKSSNEILTELFSTFDVDANAGDSGDDSSDSGDSHKNKQSDNEKSKKKKLKKKHKHKDKKHKIKIKKEKDKDKKDKKIKKLSTDSESELENGVSKKKKKKKKSKRKRQSSVSKSDKEEPNSKKHKSSDQNNTDVKSKRIVTVKKEKDTDTDDFNMENKEKEKIAELPSISTRLDDDPEAPQVPKLLEKTKTSVQGKILIKDLKNSEVYSKTVEEVENKKKEMEEHMEDGEISDSDGHYDRTPTLSPSPSRSLKVGGLYSDRKENSYLEDQPDLRTVLKEKEKNKSRSSRDYRSSTRNSHDSHSKDRDRDYSRRGRSNDRSISRRSRRDSLDDRKYSSSRRRSRDSYRTRSEDRNKSYRGRSRSRNRKERIEIDKKKLLEIARKNAINMIKKGKLPLAQQDKAIAAIQAGGRTIEELTDFCKSLSKSEAMGELSSISSGDESGSEKGFHHPFMLKDRPSSIIMNIKDAKQLPTKSFLEKATEPSSSLRLLFPVSSGQQHRKNENEWVPVIKPKPKPEPKKKFIPATEEFHTTPQPIPTVGPPILPPVIQATPATPAVQTVDATAQPYQDSNSQSVFPEPPTEPIDISSIVSQRLAAMRKLSENPHDVEALGEMYKAQNEMKTWVESKQVPGQFTGSTGARVLTPAELSSGYQAWAKKDQLLKAQPVSGGMGMALLQKMGWTPGEGLGKNKEGTLVPLQLEVKLDRKGLVSDQDVGAARMGRIPKNAVPTVKSLEGKHPVSLLGEYCSKRKLGAPQYELCFECGPDHKKNFLFKVRVNGIEYQPTVASPNKKLAKAEAAQICLQSLGLLPTVGK